MSVNPLPDGTQLRRMVGALLCNIIESGKPWIGGEIGVFIITILDDSPNELLGRNGLDVLVVSVAMNLGPALHRGLYGSGGARNERRRGGRGRGGVGRRRRIY